MHKNKSKLGFSLIELSVVLVVIGILLIGVAKGTIIARSARIKSSASLTNSSSVASIPDLAFWLDTTDENNFKTSTVANIATTNYGSISNGDSISAWLDRNPQSVNKITVTASGADSTRPTYVANGINGLPSLNFVRASAQKLSSNVAPISEGNDTYTLIAVFKPTSLSSNGYVVSQSPVTPVNGRQGSIFLTTTSLVMSGFNNDCAPANIAVNNNYIVVMRVNNNLSSNITAYKNNTQSVCSSSSISTLNIGAEIIVVGARTASGNPFEGLISEIIIYNRALTNAEIDSINSYLSTKYAIKLN